MPTSVPRPPWMYNTPYLQNLYQQNATRINSDWSAWVAQNPAAAARMMQQGGGNLPGGGPMGYTPPSQQNWPGGNMPINYSGYDPLNGPYGAPAGNPFGPLSNGQYGGDSSSGGGGNPGAWYNSFLGQAGINTGLNLLGGYLQGRAQNKADKSNQKAVADRIRQALAALSPEHIMQLAQQYLPQMAANNFQAGQTAVQAVREQAGRTGQLEGPRALSFEAGTRARLAGDTQRQAFEHAFNTASGQSAAITGAPYTPIQPRMGFADAIINSANQAYYARARSQPQLGYRLPGMNLSPGNVQGDPAFRQLEGTPYQWGFNPARF